MKLYKTYRYRIWTSKDGKNHKISEMTTSHIINCMKLITMSLFPSEYSEQITLLKYDFVMKHGKRYYKAFYHELNTRSLMRNL